MALQLKDGETYVTRDGYEEVTVRAFRADEILAGDDFYRFEAVDGNPFSYSANGRLYSSQEDCLDLVKLQEPEQLPKKKQTKAKPKHRPKSKVTITIDTNPDGSVHTSWTPHDRLLDIIASIGDGLGVPNDTTFAERMGASAVVFLANWINELEKQAAFVAAKAPSYGGELKYS